MSLEDEVRSSPFAEQLAFVREQEARTHRNRRRTNWLVTLFTAATLTGGAVLGTVILDHVDTIVQNQHIIIHNQQLICAQNHIQCERFLKN